MTEGFRVEGSLAIIGGGRMGEAILSGLIGSGAIEPERISVAEPSEQRCIDLVADYGIRCVADNSEALPADTVILAVKPQIIDGVVSALSAKLASSLVVSIAAGISCARLESLLPAGTAVVRVMPNTPAMIGAGMSVVSGGSEATAEQIAYVTDVFALLGKSLALDERYQDVATAISGSGPAYFALVIDALSRAGVAHGLPREIAQELAVQTMLGTARLIDETGAHPEALIDAVTSPGGTTIAAVEALESRAIRSAFAEAVAAAVRRAKELGT